MTKHWVMARFSALGDALLTTGVMDYFAKTQGFSFTVLTKAALAPIFEHHPAVQRIIGLTPNDLTPGALIKIANRLSSDKSGLLDLHGNLRTNLLSMFWRGPVRRYPKFGMTRRVFLLSGGRIGGEALRKECVTRRYAMSLTDSPPAPELLLPKIYLTDDERAPARALLRRAGGRKPVVALHPYATHINKAWPAEYWKDLGNRLSSQGVDWIVIGRDGNPVRGMDIKGNIRFGEGQDFTNATTLRETAALLDQTDLLISGDSGPMHLAAAVGTPVIALFGPTTEEWGFYPQGPKDTILTSPANLSCRPCSLHGGKACRHDQKCMRTISPARVADVVLDRLGL